MNFNLHVLVLLCLVLYFAFMKSVYFHSTDTCMQIITGTYVYSLLLKRVIATDSNKIKVIVLDDQKSRELRRIRTTGLAVYLYDCTIL